MPKNNPPSDQISIEFGVLAKPISEQLKSQNRMIKGVDRFNELADAIVRLHLNKIISDGVRDKARENLMKQISKEIQKGS
jgi:hypothetical protein